MEDIEIIQTRGPTLRFTGTLLAEEEWEGRSGPMRLELWETAGGALIPLSEGPMPGRPSERDIRADVVEPIYRKATRSQPTAEPGISVMAEVDEVDHEAMRMAVMDFFDWENRARSMVRKQVKWNLVRQIA